MRTHTERERVPTPRTVTADPRRRASTPHVAVAGAGAARTAATRTAATRTAATRDAATRRANARATPHRPTGGEAVRRDARPGARADARPGARPGARPALQRRSHVTTRYDDVARRRRRATGGRRVDPRRAAERPALRKRVVKVRTRRHHFRAGETATRLRVVLVVTSLVFVAIIARVVWLQTRDADALREAGRAQRTSETTLRADRGVIFDRNGDELAISVPSTTVIANPRLVGDPTGTAQALATVLALSPERQQKLIDAFTAKESSFVYVARQVSDDLAEAVDLLDLAGVDLIPEDQRTMPSGAVGQSVIGKVDIDGVGIAGIEMQFDDLLTGVDGETTRQHDRDGRSLPGSETITVAPIPGQDIVLTIDRSVQYAVEQALLEQVANLGARGGSAVVMDTDTGEIIAMVGVRTGEDGVVRVTSGNIAAVDAAEPGSVVKAITVAAALNEGTVTPDTMFHVPYRKKYSDGELHDAEVHPDYTWPVHQILAKSSNIGTIEVMLTMGETLRDTKQLLGTYMRAVGLGEKTALDFPGESRGLGVDWTKWEGTEQYTVSYGQGIASTSIQLVSAINVIANGGVYVAPKLVGATIDAHGELTETDPSGSHRVFRPEVAQQVNYMMRDVVCTGTAKLAQVDGVSVAGKTGTGLKAQDGGGYEDENGNRKYYSSFAGFFPAEDPQVTVLISIDEPPGDAEQQTRFGGTAAAPVFADIAPTIIHEMNLTLPATGGGCAG
ncbi:MAG: penicillin-binding protein 2 [Acidimicrobiales bacterium]|nr:penicillin-binding protein 2 [Acidimicrobiales bacterium]MCB9394444.1 penicillin-binding protein 2 [Acidimicrobiaceae bacterium]